MSIAIARIDPDRFTGWQPLLELILDAFAHMEGRIDPPSSALKLTPQALRQKAVAETGIVALEDGRLLGTVFCKPEPQSLYIGKFAISPAAQGRGLGRLLLAAATERAKELRLPELRLETRIELVENHRIFARWGFVKTGERAHPGYGRITTIEMRKAL